MLYSWIEKYILKKMSMIVTEEPNNENMIMNAPSMIYENNKEYKFKGFSRNTSSCIHIKIVKLV